MAISSFSHLSWNLRVSAEVEKPCTTPSVDARDWRVSLQMSNSDVVLLPESFLGVAPSAPVQGSDARTDLSHKVFAPVTVSSGDTSTAQG
jgi:hypothetical protein